MGKVISRGNYEKTDHSKVKCFLHISRETEIHTMGKWIPIVRQKYQKTQKLHNYVFLKYFSRSKNPHNFHNTGTVNPHYTGKLWDNTNIPKYGFLTYFAWNRNPYNFENMEKVNSYSKGNLWENTNITKLWFFFHISWEALIHAIPKIWKKWIPIVRRKYGKTETFQS